MRFQEIIILALCCIYFGSTGNVEILGSHSSTPFDQNWLIANVYDGSDSKCFCTQSPGGTAYVEIVLAEVSQVSLLNRDFMPQRLTGIQIEVCEGSQCNLCGTVPATGDSVWANINCAGSPLKGNRLVFKSTAQNELSFCELKVEGTTIATRTNVLGASASTAFDQNWQIFQGYHLQGTSSDPKKCYCSQTDKAQATMDIPMSDVTQVALLNRYDADFAFRLGGITVEVCEKGGSCQSCGSIPDTPVSEWGVAACPNGPIKGNQIKLFKDSNALSFCDTEVFVIPPPAPAPAPGYDCLCQDYHRFCPALNDPNFAANYKQLLENGDLDGFGKKIEPPTPMDCSNSFYIIGCPKSCKKCSC